MYLENCDIGLVSITGNYYSAQLIVLVLLCSEINLCPHFNQSKDELSLPVRKSFFKEIHYNSVCKVCRVSQVQYVMKMKILSQDSVSS